MPGSYGATVGSADDLIQGVPRAVRDQILLGLGQTTAGGGVVQDRIANDPAFADAYREALRAAGDIALAEGTLMVGLPEWADMIGESEAERFAEARIEPEGYVAAAHAAVEIAAEALRKARDGDAAIADILARDSFETLIGPVSFDEKGDMAQSRFVLQRYDGERFVPVD